MMPSDKKVLSIEFAGLSGEARKMTVLKMSHRDFFETYHSVLQAISGTMKIGKGKLSFNPLQVLQSLDFDTFENLACKLLDLGILEGEGTISNPFESAHFMQHPDELYVAVYSAFVAQNPDMFPKKSTESKMAGSDSDQKAEERK